jgi:3-oxoacyl-[acyl-carrier protein] reductase
MKYALVTSSTKGIGKAIGLSLIKKGYYVFFNYYHDDKRAIVLSNEILEINQYKDLNNYSIIKADMTQFDSITVLYNEIMKVTQSIDCVVLNTGITNRKTFNEIKKDEFVNVINANVTIPLFLLQQLYNHINNNSRIICIGSILGQVPHARSLPYAISKSAVTSMVKNLVKYFKDKETTVNAVSCGFIDTDWHEEKSDIMKNLITNNIALGRFGRVDEVAQLCMSIIDNDYVNGANLVIDGGYDL